VGIEVKPASERARHALAEPTLHELWAENLVVPQAAFFDRAFGRLREVTDAPAGATILDAGCGTGHHALRLARNGWRVHAVDFSDAALEIAQRNLDGAPDIGGRVMIQKEDLTKLSLSDASHDYALCWGVLMHIPDISAAVRELCRVLAPGGKLVVSEFNMSSPESRALRAFARARSSPGRRMPACAEHWHETESGSLLIRHMDLNWLRREFSTHNVVLRGSFAGQLSEVHALLAGRAKLASQAVRWLNSRVVWSKTLASVAMSNILVFEKPR